MKVAEWSDLLCANLDLSSGLTARHSTLEYYLPCRVIIWRKYYSLSPSGGSTLMGNIRHLERHSHSPSWHNQHSLEGGVSG